MKIAMMIPMDDTAAADGSLWPMAWSTDAEHVFGIDFPELDGRIPRLPQDAAAHVQEEIESFLAVGHKRMYIETRSEAVLKRVREMARTQKDFEASVYLVRSTERGLEETRHDVLPDGSLEPPLVLDKLSSQAATCEEGPVHESGFALGEVDHHGELELVLEVNGAKGSAWLSREMWERMGEVAGWRTQMSAVEQTAPVPLTEEEIETLIFALRSRPPFDGDGDLLRKLRTMKRASRRDIPAEEHGRTSAEPPKAGGWDLERLALDAEEGARMGHAAGQHQLAARLESCAEVLRALLPLQQAVEELKRTINEGIEITHDQAIKIEQLELFVGQRFKELSGLWRQETGHLSNPHKRLEHPAYRAIVKLGWPVVPFLLGELASDTPDLWGPALHQITGEFVTIAEGDVGKLEASAEAWLKLAGKKGWKPRFKKTHRHDGFTEWHCSYCFIMEGEQHRPWCVLEQAGHVQGGGSRES